MKEYIIIIFLLLTNSIYAQLFQNDKADKVYIEKILTENKKYNDSISLNENEKKLIASTTNKHKLLITKAVFKILRAENHLQYDDDLNTSSDTNYRNAISIAKNIKSLPLEVYSNLRYGVYLYNYRQIEKSLPYYLQNANLLESIPDSKLVFPGETYKLMGFYFGTLGELKSSINYLKLAESKSLENEKELAVIQDNIGFYYLLEGEYKLGLEYLKKAEKHALNINDKERYAKVLGNIGIYYHNTGNYQKAIAYLQKDLQLSKSLGSNKNTMFALIQLSRSYLAINDKINAEKYINEAEQFAKSKSYYKNNEHQIAQIQLTLAKQSGDDAKELEYRRKVEDLTMYINNTDGANAIEKTNWNFQMQKFNDNLQIEKEKNKTELIALNASILVLILLIVLLFLLYHFKNKKIILEKEQQEIRISNLKLEISQAEEKLNNTNQSLASYREVLYKKNNQIEALTKQIDVKNKNTNSEDKNLDKILESHLMTEENWLNFKKIFILEKPEYFNHLKSNFPDLTDANLRLLMLMKLGLGTHEISNTLGITTDAIKKAKQRLRKKYTIRYEELL